jgi:uncharacterized membrane protein HdeD (DUF308 family)
MTATPRRGTPAADADGQWPAPTGPDESAVPFAQAVTGHRHWLRLLAGIVAIALGIAAYAWPHATVQVIAVLFGVNLIVTGFVRAGLSLFQTTYPVFYRLLSVVFGVLTGLIGILCLRNPTGSLVLLVVVVALGWLLDGLAQIMLGIGGPAEERHGARIATGLIMVLGAIAILVWPKIGFGVFIFIGATVLVFVGIGAVISAIAGMRTHHA